MCIVPLPTPLISFFFFFNDTATTEIYTLSLHDALPISSRQFVEPRNRRVLHRTQLAACVEGIGDRSEEHTSELQSRLHLVCRLLLEKKKAEDHNHGDDAAGPEPGWYATHRKRRQQ